jgi:hypothetical protein
LYPEEKAMCIPLPLMLAERLAKVAGVLVIAVVVLFEVS